MVLLTHILTVLSSLLLLPGVFGVKFHGNHTALEEVAGRKVLAIACPQAHPNVNETAIFLAACKQNPQNSIKKCVRQLTGYANTSITSTCQHYYTVLNACLIQNNNNQTACNAATVAYQGCGDIALQAFAYCGCYFNLPDDISRCAIVQLGIGLNLEIAPDNPSAVTGAPIFGPTEPPTTVTVTTTALSQVTSIVTTTFSTRATSTVTTTFTSPVTSTVTSTYAKPVTSTITTTNGAGVATTITTTAISQATTTLTTTYTSGATATVTTTYTSGATATIPTTYLNQVTITITQHDPAGPPGTVTAAAGTVTTTAGTVTTTAYSQITDTVTTTDYITSLSTISLCGPGISSCPPESCSTKTVTTTAVSTYISCYGGCTSTAVTGPTFLPVSSSSSTYRSTSTYIFEYLTTETLTFTSDKTTYLSTTTEHATVTSYQCPGGCSLGTAAAPTHTVCVRRKRPILAKKDEI